VAAFEARPTEAHKAIIAQLLRDDAELQGIAREYVKLGMRELLRQLQAGDAATRAAIAKSLSRVVTAAITEGAEDDGDQTLRAEMHEMMAEMRGDLMEKADVTEVRVIVPKGRAK
jgi:hypothetical protein